MTKDCKRKNKQTQAWFVQKEQSAGRGRLAILWTIYRFCPLWLFRGALFIVGTCIWIFAGPARKASCAYRDVLNTARKKRGLQPVSFTSHAHIMSYVTALFDKVDAAALCKQKLRLEIDQKGDFSLLLKRIQAKEGIFFLCSHVGSIEILQSLYTQVRAFPPRIMHAFQDTTQSQIFFEFYRKHCHDPNVFIHPTDEIDMSTAAEMKSFLEKGELVMMAADRISKNVSGRQEKVVLLDKYISLPHGAFTFARLMESPIFFIACIKTAPNTYTLFTRQAPIKGIVSAYTSFLEELILNYPLAFFQFYDYFGSASDN